MTLPLRCSPVLRRNREGRPVEPIRQSVDIRTFAAAATVGFANRIGR